MNEWINIETMLPDDESTVLIAMDDGEVWTGFTEAGQWFYVSGDPINESHITHWMDFPGHPLARAA